MIHDMLQLLAANLAQDSVLGVTHVQEAVPIAVGSVSHASRMLSFRVVILKVL